VLKCRKTSINQSINVRKKLTANHLLNHVIDASLPDVGCHVTVHAQHRLEPQMFRRSQSSDEHVVLLDVARDGRHGGRVTDAQSVNGQDCLDGQPADVALIEYVEQRCLASPAVQRVQ